MDSIVESRRYAQWENNFLFHSATAKMLHGWSHDDNLQKASIEAKTLIDEYRAYKIDFNQLTNILWLRGCAHDIESKTDKYCERAAQFFFTLEQKLLNEFIPAPGVE